MVFPYKRTPEFLKSQPVLFNTAYMVPERSSNSGFAIVATRF